MHEENGAAANQSDTAAADSDQTRDQAGTAEAVQGATEATEAKPAARKRPSRRRAASRPAGPPESEAGVTEDAAEAEPSEAPAAAAEEEPSKASAAAGEEEPPKRPRRPRKKAAAAKRTQPVAEAPSPDQPSPDPAGPLAPVATGVLFKPPEFVAPEPAEPQEPEEPQAKPPEADAVGERQSDEADGDDDDGDDGGASRRRRRRGGRGRRKKGEPAAEETAGTTGEPETATEEKPGQDADGAEQDGDGTSTTGSRRRRRRKRKSDSDGEEPGRPDDPPNTVVKVRETREAGDEVSALKGSTRLEAKKQRRREGREAGRRRPPVISESEFLARREAVERVMAVRQKDDLIQIAVLEDGVLVEHYVSRASEQPLVGNVYLGRVQNVLPAMEAAFVDIGRGRNAVLYAGEVDWAGLGQSDGPKRIEEVLKSGQSIVVQVTKEPAGHKGARLTSQISLPGRYVVYVPGGSMSGISRKLPEKERNRLKKILKQVVPEDAGVIVRTAAEGASEEELTHDVSRLRAQWEEIQKKTSGSAPQLLHGEPDLAIKVVRDLFNEDFARLVVSGDSAWKDIESYVSYVASSLRDRLEQWSDDHDIFAAYRIDEQIAKALERKVWLPSGGSLVIDRTEAMTVIDVNTGKFTGSGGNLEETVTKNNLEAAEEIVRQLRLRDIGGIVVIDFIDMVLESNRDLVLRRLVECLGRDRTKHQVAEVTSLGLVQMTRKRIGTGLLEAFSEKCDACNGRGLHVHAEPVNGWKASSGGSRSDRPSRRERRRRAQAADEQAEASQPLRSFEASAAPGEASPADLVPVGSDAEAEPDAEAEKKPAPESDQAEPAQDQPAAEEDRADKSDTTTRPSRGRRRARRPAGSPDTETAVAPV